jgi:hypothetical protein
MKYILTMTLFLLGSASICAGAWQWAHGFGSPGMESAWDLAVDYGQGDIFVSGEYTDSLTIGGTTYQALGLSDCFIAKYDESGLLQWVKTFGSVEQDVCLSIDVDDDGNCYFTGFYTGTMTMEGFTIQGSGLWDVFYGKLATNGDLVWLKNFGGDLNDIGYGLAACGNGEFYITGWFASTIDFAAGISISSHGGSDIYLAKFDTNGNPLWARHAGTEGVEYGYKVDASPFDGCAYVTGAVSPGSSFDGLVTDAAGMFVAKYDPNGNIQWVLPSYGAGALNIAVDKHNSVGGDNVVIGRITGTGMIGGTVINSVNGSDDVYVAHFSTGGTWTGVEHYGGPGSDKGRAADVRYNVTTLSTFEDEAQFGGSALSSVGSLDIAVTHSGCSPLSAGSVNPDVGTDIKLLGGGRFVVTGWFSGQMRFGTHLLDSGNDTNLDCFVALYDPYASAADDGIAEAVPTLHCYPNPGTDLFTFEAKTTDRIEIYNLRGQLVRSLEPESRKGGLGVFRWDSTDVNKRRCPAGVYLARSSQASRKVMLLPR